ncbi:hypothetical protein GGF50DRAFT_112710 [Schizophyllum commune]
MRAGVDQVDNLLLALHDHVSHGTLRNLHLCGTQRSGTGLPLRLHHMDALAAFPHLAHVTLDATLDVLLTDDEHAQIAGWWPELEPAMLDVLIHYAPACLKLRGLEIPLIIHSIPKVPDDLTCRASQYPLERLFLGNSTIDQTCDEEAAAFWRVLFPKCGIRSKT